VEHEAIKQSWVHVGMRPAFERVLQLLQDVKLEAEQVVVICA